MKDTFHKINREILTDPENRELVEKGYQPLYVAHASARILIVGQAPGRKTQQAGRAWQDSSGDRLRTWLGVTADQFYDSSLFAQLPMDFFYPGKARTGDNPPRKGFAAKWHPRLLALMPKIRLFILAGQSAQTYYLGKQSRPTLTENVRHYQDYLPRLFPIVHPSPLNFRWHRRNPWFEDEVVPELQAIVGELIGQVASS